MLSLLDAQQAAMKRLDSRAIEEAAREQQASRARITSLENRRRAAVQQIAVALRLGTNPTMARIAEALPQDKPRLLKLREQLKHLIGQVAHRAQVVGRLAGAVLGHLNTVVRLIAGSVEQAGLYTKDGVPRVSARIGVLEAVA